MMARQSLFERLRHDKRAAIAATVLMGLTLAVFPFVIGSSLGNSWLRIIDFAFRKLALCHTHGHEIRHRIVGKARRAVLGFSLCLHRRGGAERGNCQNRDGISHRCPSPGGAII